MKISSVRFYNAPNVPVFFKGQMYDESKTPKAVVRNEMQDIPFDKSGFYTSNIKHKPILDNNTFQIRMWGYAPLTEDKEDRAAVWNKNMLDLTYKISDMISENQSFDKILKTAEYGINKINGRDYGKRDLDERYYPLEEENIRGQEYWDTYNNFEEYEKPETVESYWKALHNTNKKTLHKPKANEEYKDANTCKIIDREWRRKIYYGRNKEKPYYNLELAKREYNKLKLIKHPHIGDINRSCATIQWLIAQESPYAHGNDSIANVLTKAIYHSYGIKTGQIKAGHSLDFEAFYRDLDDYIKIYPHMFENETALCYEN